MNDVTVLYTRSHKRLNRMHDAIMQAVMEHSDDEMSVGEVVGLLETIKFEIMLGLSE